MLQLGRSCRCEVGCVEIGGASSLDPLTRNLLRPVANLGSRWLYGVVVHARRVFLRFCRLQHDCSWGALVGVEWGGLKCELSFASVLGKIIPGQSILVQESLPSPQLFSDTAICIPS